MKRLIPLVLLAALTGAAMAGAAVVLLGDIPGKHITTVVSTATAGGSANGSSTRDISASSSEPLTAAQVYRQDSSGVVAIRAVTASGQDSGTGVVLNDSGLILTNDHVIAEANAISVSPGKSSGETRTATLVGADPSSDLALIKIDPSGLGLKPLKLASSSTAQVGDPVYAIGNPYGLDETLTRGIVSALGREIQAPDGATIKGAIQTDAALNPGNSGGPLIDARGEVIGINSQIASEQADTAGSQPGSTGVGFAISSNTVTEVVKAIESGATGSTAGTTGSGSTGSEVGSGEESPYATGTSGGVRGQEAQASEASTGTSGSAAGGYGPGAGQVVIVP